MPWVWRPRRAGLRRPFGGRAWGRPVGTGFGSPYGSRSRWLGPAILIGVIAIIVIVFLVLR
jgi:hypothetical protein